MSASRSDLEHWALAALPPDDSLMVAEKRRLVEALEAVHRSARGLGLDPIEQYASFATRCDAWLYRAEQRWAA
jgi:hypothetical protein